MKYRTAYRAHRAMMFKYHQFVIPMTFREWYGFNK